MAAFRISRIFRDVQLGKESFIGVVFLFTIILQYLPIWHLEPKHDFISKMLDSQYPSQTWNAIVWHT